MRFGARIHHYVSIAVLGIVACGTSGTATSTPEPDLKPPAVTPRFSVKKPPFETRDFYACSLSPAPVPSAATVAVEGGPSGGLYLLRLVAGKPTLQKLNSDWSLNGFWTGDGQTYVYRDRAFDVATGDAQKLPPFPGRFLCLSPDRRLIVSSKLDTGDGPDPPVAVYQTNVETGAVVSENVPRAAARWLADSTHLVPGTIESAQIWIAAHFKWKKDAHGHDRLDLPKE